MNQEKIDTTIFINADKTIQILRNKTGEFAILYQKDVFPCDKDAFLYLEAFKAGFGLAQICDNCKNNYYCEGYLEMKCGNNK